MNAPIPENDLDRAIRALIRSQSAMPDLLRALSAGDIWFLMEFHPDLEGAELSIENGDPLPFIILQDDQGQIVPLFSSGERLDEAMRSPGAPKKKFMAGMMPVQQAMTILGAMKLRAMINQGCATGNIIIGPDLMRDVANGTVLKPQPKVNNRPVEKTLCQIDPADYPTDLIQPLFEHMRQHHQFRAAWVFGEAKGKQPPEALPKYYVLVLMQPVDEQLFHEFNIVAQAAKRKWCEVELSLTDPDNKAEIVRVFLQAQPFFLAPDYHPPRAK